MTGTFKTVLQLGLLEPKWIRNFIYIYVYSPNSDPTLRGPVECDDIVPGNPVGSVKADALRPAHICSVSGVVAMGVSD